MFCIGAPTDEDCITIFRLLKILPLPLQWKEIMMDIISTIVAEMTEKMRLAEEKARNPFYNRTNVYRAEDGRPICFCCLKVGHVAKYCWNRKFSCQHVVNEDLSQEHPPSSSNRSFLVASLNVVDRHADFDINSLERQVNELKGITKEVQQIQTPRSQNAFEEVAMPNVTCIELNSKSWAGGE